MGRGCAKKSCAPPLNLIPSLNLISEFAPDKSNVEDIITYALNLEKINTLSHNSQNCRSSLVKTRE